MHNARSYALADTLHDSERLVRTVVERKAIKRLNVDTRGMLLECRFDSVVDLFAGCAEPARKNQAGG